MFDNLKDWYFMRRFLNKIKKPLRKKYTRKMVKYNLKIVKMVYTNLARRYSINIRECYNFLPLKVKIDKELEGAYGVCSRYMEKTSFFNKKMKLKSTIALNVGDITTTTFIHEFGHYVRFLIEQIAIVQQYTKNKNSFNDFVKITDLVRSRADVAMKERDNFWTRGFTVDEEENFAKSWEKYLRDGIAPCKHLNSLFNNFKKAIFDDMHDRNKRRNYEFFEDLEVNITPERRNFFDLLLLGKRYKKQSIIMKMLEWYIYIMLFFATIFLMLKVFVKLLK